MTLAAAAFVGVLMTPTAKATEIGSVVAVVTQAEVSGEIGERELAIGVPVYSGDLVRTDQGGEVQLLFSDGTRMVLGPGSELVLEEYVFRGDAATNRFAVRALAGAFRFITGVGNPENYSITTPSAKIGVRGTIVEFFVDRNSGETDVRLREGEAEVCNEDGEDCEEIVLPCGFVSTRNQEKDPKVVEDEAQLKQLSEREDVRYFDENEERFQEDFRVGAAISCIAAGGLSAAAIAAGAGAAAATAAAVAAGGGPVSPAE